MPTIEEKLVEWQKELLQFDNRNRLLNLKYSSTRPSMIPLVGPAAEDIYLQLASGKQLTLMGTDIGQEIEPDDTNELETANQFSEEPSDFDLSASVLNFETEPPIQSIGVDPLRAKVPALAKGFALSSLSSQKLAAVAHRLSDKARSSEQEQGIAVLYAAFGLLNWKEESGSKEERRSPLLLLPLTIAESVRGSAFQISANTASDPELNLTLIERIRRDFGLNIGFEFDEDASLQEVFSNVRDAIRTKVDWSVTEEVYLGIFQFHKFRMFKDLSEHAAIAAQNEIVNALGLDGVTLGAFTDTLSEETDLDQLVQPADSFTILDADSSQLRAIESVKRGGNLIISGPPGTGKSQTIANIIAECLVARKTVLFVAEKSAALEVVHQRLASRGLDEFCLMLHSQKATKRDVILALGSRMNQSKVSKAGPEEELGLRRLAETRQQLNAYVSELSNENSVFGKSPSWVHGQLAKLRLTPNLVARPPNVESMSFEDFDRWTRQIEALLKHYATLKEGENHPWAGIDAPEFSLSERNSLHANLELVQKFSEELRRYTATIAGQLHTSAPTTLSEVQILLDIQSDIPQDLQARTDWFNSVALTTAKKLVADAREQAIRMADSDPAILSEYSSAFLMLSTDKSIISYESSTFFSRMFSSTYKAHRAEVRTAHINQRQQHYKTELIALKNARQLNSARDWFRTNASELRNTLGIAPNGETFSLESLEFASMQIAKTASIVDRFPQVLLSQELISALCTPGLASRTVDSALAARNILEDLRGAVSNVKSVFSGDTIYLNGIAIESAALQEINKWVSLKIEQFDALDSWLDAKAEMKRVKSEGLESIADALIRQNVRNQDWADSFRKLVLTHWLDHNYRKSTTLREFRVDTHEHIAASFRDLDRRFVTSSAVRLRRELIANQPALSIHSGGEPEILLREVGKQRRHLPIRKLFERIPNLLLTLKPCLMMSPLSVAQFLSADHYKFDVVIFDEASQVRPHDAIGAIMRGNQLVVAGDRKQLPPTSFFDRQTDDPTPEDESSLKDMESILDALQSKEMPSSQLLWHYRSRHEELIAFSNHHFYGDRLITFPTPSSGKTPGRGVYFEHVVGGAYLDERDKVLRTPLKVNRIEAKKVAQLVMNHARNRPDESLGVVALGSNQKGVVAEEIKSARMLDSSADEFFREDKELPFFVKALEEVQGDERDVMIISIGFGKGADGRLSHNFGPINREGGERRLNVLITRAKNQVIVVSSIRASEIDLNRTQQLGPRLLRQYLDFAERGTLALEAATTGGNGEYESPFEEEVGAALERAGFGVHRQIGCSRFRIDLAIIDPRAPGRYLLGVECDGATYHSSKTARDRDRLRQEILESLGWKIHRVWSTDWIRQPDKEFGRLLLRISQEMESPETMVLNIEQAVAYSGTKESSTVFPGAPFLSEEPIAMRDSSIAVPRVQLYVEAHFTTGGYPDILSAPLSSIVESVANCVDVESPIHHDVLLRRISSGWGYSRTGARITEQLGHAIQSALRNGRIVKRGDFYWSLLTDEVKVRAASSNGSLRGIDHIAGEEILGAFEIVLNLAMSLTHDELIQRTARLFGYQRTGTDIQRRLDAMIRLALVNEKLESKNGRLVMKQPRMPSVN